MDQVFLRPHPTSYISHAHHHYALNKSFVIPVVQQTRVFLNSIWNLDDNFQVTSHSLTASLLEQQGRVGQQHTRQGVRAPLSSYWATVMRRQVARCRSWVLLPNSQEGVGACALPLSSSRPPNGALLRELTWPCTRRRCTSWRSLELHSLHRRIVQDQVQRAKQRGKKRGTAAFFSFPLDCFAISLVTHYQDDEYEWCLRQL